MPRPTEDQLSYQRRTVRLCQIAQAVVTRHNRLDTVTLDDGAVPMLPDSADHKLSIPTGAANVDVLILAHWFHDPDLYRDAIPAAVEATFDPQSSAADDHNQRGE
jgi:hypothetical protein